jgi:TonB family protein
MSGNEFQGKKAEGRDEDYERTVLNFLNKEIAQTQSEGDAGQNQSNDVDSIVSNLMKQVITESDSRQSDQPLHRDNLDSLLSEFPDARKDGPLPNEESDNSIMANPPDHAPALAPAHEVPAEIFASTFAQGTDRKMPAKAIALVFALGIIAAAIYFFAGHRSSPPNNAGAPASISNPAPQSQVAQPAPQPAQEANVAARQELPPNPVAAVASEKPLTAKPELKEPSKSESTQNIAANGASTPAKKESALNPPDTQASFAASTALQFAPAPVTSNTIVISALENASLVKPPIAPPPPVPEPPAASASPAPADPAVSRDVIPATLISHAAPNYPVIALRTRASATIVLDLQIDNTGKVIKATPVSGPDIFFGEAVKAAMKWRYKPASVNGTNVPSKSSVKMQFKFN